MPSCHPGLVRHVPAALIVEALKALVRLNHRIAVAADEHADEVRVRVVGIAHVQEVPKHRVS